MAHHFELLATTSDGEDIYDHELRKYAPKPADPAVGETVYCPRSRAGAVAMRKRLLEAHPGATVRVFEVPDDSEEWASAAEDWFKPSDDGLTLIPKPSVLRRLAVEKSPNVAQRTKRGR